MCGSRTCKPNSVCRIAPAGRSFLWAGHCCAAQATYPEVVTHRASTCSKPKPRAPSLFGLAPCGVCPARRITATAVRSYRTFSPLPRRCHRGGMFSVALSVEWPAQAKLGWGTLPDVIRHTALRSSDFPPASSEDDASDRPVQLPTLYCNSRRSSVFSRRTSGVGPQTKLLHSSGCDHTAKGQRPTTNGQRPTAKDQRPTTNGQRPVPAQFGKFLSSFWIFQKALGSLSLTGGNGNNFWCGSVWYQKATLV